MDNQSFIVKNTNSALDDLDVVTCGEPHQVLFKNANGHIEKITIRPILSMEGTFMDVDTDEFYLQVEDKEVSGIYIDVRKLEEVEKEEKSWTPRFVRSFTVKLQHDEIFVVEYEDLLQVSVHETRKMETWLSCYIPKVYLATVKEEMFKCSTDQDVVDFVAQMEKIKI